MSGLLTSPPWPRACFFRGRSRWHWLARALARALALALALALARAQVRNVFVLDSCLPIVGAEVLSFGSEAALLDAWAAFVRDVDADVLTG